MIKKENRTKGFTLLELLIVISILAILSVALVLILNPAETLKKSRDSQRMSDLSTMKMALGLYLTTVTTPDLTTDTTDNDRCANGGDPSIFYSDTVTAVGAVDFAAGANTGTTVDGAGWLPVDFRNISGGSPISNLPIDPVNTVANPVVPTSTDLVYRYACNKDNLTFELNAKLESDAFTSDDNKAAKDGGNHATLFEVGSNLTILPATNDF